MREASCAYDQSSSSSRSLISRSGIASIHRDTTARPTRTPSNAHPDTNERLERRASIDKEVLVPLHHALLEQNDDRRATCHVRQRDGQAWTLDRHSPNAKYPNSSPLSTVCPSSTTVRMLPTIIAPTHTAITRPNWGLSMGIIFRAFSPYTSSALRIACGCIIRPLSATQKGNRRGHAR